MSRLSRTASPLPVAVLLSLVLARALGAPALAQTGGMAAPPHQQRPPAGTYISGATLPDTTQVLPPPPLPGSPEQAADDAVFRQSRALAGTPRWALAANDARLDPRNVLADFSCALGFVVDPAKAPVLMSLLAHADADMSPEIEHTKNFWKRRRPYIGNDLPICVARRGSLDDNPSYPSGHTTLEYGTALMLAELMPDRAGPIMQRGRTLSESRLVCGVHWLSDVQAGFIEASTLVAALHGSERFRTDMARARKELVGLQRAAAEKPDAASCQVQADAAAHSLLFRKQPASP